MLERRPGHRAVILEQEDVAQPEVLLEIEHALAARPQDTLDLRFGHQRERPIVMRRLDDHLVGADPVHAIEHPLAFAVDRPFHLERRKLVRHDADVPPGRVPPPAVLAVRQQLRRRHRLVTRTERTVLAPDRGRPLETEVVRTLLPVGRNNHPSSGDGIFAELRHVFSVGRYSRFQNHQARPSAPPNGDSSGLPQTF